MDLPRLLARAARDEERAALDALDPTPASSSASADGWFWNHVAGTREQLALLDGLRVEAHLNADEVALLVQILARTPHAFATGDGFVPVPSKAVERHVRKADWRVLEAAGLVEVREYDRFGRQCRAFRVPAGLRRRFHEAGPTAERVLHDRLYNLVRGRPTTKRTKSRRRGKSGNALPKAVRESIDAVSGTPSPFNALAVEAHLERLRAAVDAAEDGPEKARVFGRYLTDLAAYQAVLVQGAEPVDPEDPEGLWQYFPAYKPQRFGRISQIGAGFQSCSREMKEAAYTEVPNARNYDLRAAQPSILVVLMRDAEIEPVWLADYVSRPKAKVEAAERLGIAVDAWKRAFSAVIMGARVPTKVQALRIAERLVVEQASEREEKKRKRRRKGAVVSTILKAAGPDGFKDAFDRFVAYTEPLRAELGLWHGWLVEVWVPANGRLNNLDGRTYVTNAVGMKVSVEELSGKGKPWELRSRLAAFLLQGREALFVHTLAALHSEYGYVVLSHEHDGLVTQGEIPAEAIARAAEAARLPMEYVALDEKPFV